MAKVKTTFFFDEKLYRRFKALAAMRGHSMTWYFVGCMREVVGEGRRGVQRKRRRVAVEKKPSQ